MDARSPLAKLLVGAARVAERLAPLADGVELAQQRAAAGVCINCGEAPPLSEKIPTCGGCSKRAGQGALEALIDMLEEEPKR